MNRRLLAAAGAFALVAALVGAPVASATTSMVDCGSGADLQAAIDGAASGDTLRLKGTCVGTFSISGKDLALRGVGSPRLGKATLDGGSVGRSLFVDAGLTVSLADLAITNGFANDGNGGGGLLSRAASITLRNVTVFGNRSEIGGGGIENDDTMTIVNASVTGNLSIFDAGGGILNLGQLVLTDSTVGDNSAGFVGGGIANTGTARITRSALSHNSALQGGGISNSSGGASTILDSRINKNSATNLGGGIWNDPTSTMTIVRSAVNANTAPSNEGGGIANRGNLAISDSTLKGNSSRSGGGVSNFFGTLTLERSSVNGNSASVSGGGIANSAGTTTIVNSTVNGNTAGINGGGLLNAPSLVTAPTVLTIKHSRVSGNTAASGGGIINFGMLTFVAAPTVVGGNTATTGGGLLQVASIPVSGSVTGGCPTILGRGIPPSATTTGFVVYSPTNTPTDYAGFSC